MTGAVASYMQDCDRWASPMIARQSARRRDRETSKKDESIPIVGDFFMDIKRAKACRCDKRNVIGP